ncbi:MAG: ABC transporter substrate-binding protein [Planctomycetota bacterium]
MPHARSAPPAAPFLLGLILAFPRCAQEEPFGPAPAPVDAFHPDVRAGKSVPPPAYGGRIIVHLANLPKSMNRVIENAQVVTNMLYEVSDTLLRRDWETWEFAPRLAERYEVEDAVVLRPEAAGKYAAARTAGEGERRRAFLFGTVEEREEAIVVRPASAANPLAGELVLPAADVSAVERGTVFTFHLRAGVKWHDGHPFDAADVLFSWEVYGNPHVDCEELKSYYEKILAAEVLDGRTVRFFFARQYFKAIEVVGEMPLLPRHLFDLTDPDLAAHHPEALAALAREHGPGYAPTLEDRGAFVNKNPHDQGGWVDLGPYRITAWNQQYIEATRFADYWDAGDPRYGGYFDTIRWRYIADTDVAFQALLQGELDLFDRLKSEDYFGPATESEQFASRFTKGHFYLGAWGYTGWNLLRPLFQERTVRQALAHAIDMEEFRRAEYEGVARQVTGPQNYFGPGYDHDVRPLAYDPDLAAEMLAAAGWYDRDGDGWIDRDGQAFEFELLYPSGGKQAEHFGQVFQMALARIGIRLRLNGLEWATFYERVLDRDFDAAHLAWFSPLETDPEQVWHSKWGEPEMRSSNHYALRDPRVDALIERGQRELDPARRAAIWRELHAYLYDLQPCLFMFTPPVKFALKKEIRGLQTFHVSPGYSLRRLYYPAGTPGTRPSWKE